jgi:antitoxin component YwqK of YwqJK toxin-antitoxin module
MRKKLLVFIVFLTIYSCVDEPSDIQKCSLTVENGISYMEGKKYTGTCNVFYNDSVLWKTRIYKKGVERKEISYYIPGGELEWVGNSKNGEVHGDFTSYYKNGQISIEGKLKMGFYDGDWNYYDDDGSINKTLIYKNQKLIDSISYKN